MAEDKDTKRGSFAPTTRLEAFSDGVFAIAITLLVLDLSIGRKGDPLDRVLDAWPFYVAYIVSFLTIGAAWLAHHEITSRLTKTDGILLRLNLLFLLAVSFLPFPTRLVADSLGNGEGERVYVTMYGVTLLTIRVLLFALDEYTRREHLDAEEPGEDSEDEARTTVVPAAVGYLIAIGLGLLAPNFAFIVYSVVAVYLVVPLKALRRTLFKSR